MISGQVMYYFTSKEHILLETLAWQDNGDVIRARAALARVRGAWRQLERFIVHYLPGSPADPSWILWLEAWARAPHNRQGVCSWKNSLPPGAIPSPPSSPAALRREYS
jgi:AcrR family transcriptional regulator